MDWFQAIIPGLIGAVGVPLALFLWQLLLKRHRVKNWGIRVGRLVSRVLGQKIGVSGGEKVEQRIKSTVSDFIEGVFEGMDEDIKAHASR